MANRSTRICILVSLMLFGLTLFSALFLTSAESIAITSSASASITVGSACSISTTINNYEQHTTTISPGTLQEDIGLTTIKTICNDNNGYSIYAVGFSSSDGITNEYGNTKLIAKISGVMTPTYDIVTGTGTNDTTTGGISNWAMKIGVLPGTYAPTILSDANGSFSNYHIVPSSYAKIATYSASTVDPNNPSSADPTATNTGSSITTTYRAYITGTQPAGTYTGKVRYTMVHPASNIPNEPRACTENKICYWPNGGDMSVGGVGVVDTMGDQTNNYGANTDPITNNMEVQLWASNFQRSGYGFAGWATTFNYGEDLDHDGEEDSKGTIYGPNETITTPNDMSKGLSLYAVWVKSEGYLQNWNKCSTLNIGDVTALTDKRDNQTYAVAKLKDNNCWMIENLRLDNQYTTGDYYKSLAQGYASNFIGLAASENNFSDSTTANSLYSIDGSTVQTILGSNNIGWRFPRYNNINTNNTVSNMIVVNSNVYSYGNYYSWAAAIADTDDYTSNNQSVTNTSICPSGWALPKGGNSANASNSDFWKLGIAIMGFAPASNGFYQNTELNADGKNATSAFRSYPNNITYAGYFNKTNLSIRGGGGLYMSSTTNENTSIYVDRLTVGSDGAYAGSRGNAKCYGYTIRCLVSN